MRTTLLLWAAFCLLSLGQITATTIVPFPTQADMTNAAEVAVGGIVEGTFVVVEDGISYSGYTLLVTQAIKGVNVGERINVYRLSHTKADFEFRVAGDVELTVGKEYMLFLGSTGRKHLVPLTMGHGIYERVVANDTGEAFWKPISTAGLELMDHPSGVAIEPLMTYPYTTFPELLRASLRDAKFPIETYAAGEVSDARAPLSARAFPSGCDGLFTGVALGAVTLAGNRWINSTLSVIPRTGGDTGYGAATTASVVSNAVTAMESAYSGINLSVSGFSALPLPTGCTDASDNVPSNGTAQTIQLYFNDPCNQIPNLSGCSGTLAVGGSYVTGSHTFDGLPFGSNAWGYVVVNNGVSCLSQGNYAIMLEHEMTHAMGLDHIPTALFSNQNMNPTCCNPINARDIVCMNYLYAPVPLPVELIDFAVKNSDRGAELAWTTASETGSAAFVIERSEDGSNFEAIGKVEAAGVSRDSRTYAFLDAQPLAGVSYYRLRLVDLDSAEDFSEIVALDRSEDGKLSIAPNPAGVGSAVVLSGMVDEEVTITVSDVAGREVYRVRQAVIGGRTDLSLPAQVPSGLYYVRTTGAAEVLAQSVRLN